jgi:hypothetical protein
VIRRLSSSFFVGAVATVVLSAAASFVVLRSASAWTLYGFAAMAIPGLVSGAWMVRSHGRPGAGFVLALGTGVTLRVVLLSIVVAVAARQGSAELTQTLAGLAFGFVPLTVFELVWFARRTRPLTSPSESTR